MKDGTIRRTAKYNRRLPQIYHFLKIYLRRGVIAVILIGLICPVGLALAVGCVMLHPEPDWT
jgi:hypothetical protein